jgi:hypothetical protein
MALTLEKGESNKIEGGSCLFQFFQAVLLKRAERSILETVKDKTIREEELPILDCVGFEWADIPRIANDYFQRYNDAITEDVLSPFLDRLVRQGFVERNNEGLYRTACGIALNSSGVSEMVDKYRKKGYIRAADVEIIRVAVTNDALTAELSDGRTISIPLSWSPRLLRATPDERNDWELIGHGEGIHWEAVDEDISLDNLFMGQRSRERPEAIKRWLNSRAPASSRTDLESNSTK